MGVSPTNDGANFALFCRHGTAVSLVLFADDGSTHPIDEVPLDPRKNRTGDHWHIRLHNLPNTFCYGWRVDGPRGGQHRYDPTRVLVDPCSTMLSGGAHWAATCETDPERTSRRSLFHRSTPYDWGDDQPPLTDQEDSIIYELHVRGFTNHPSSGVAQPGTYLGLIEKIPYLQWLGVTAVELLPIHEFDECDCPFWNTKTGEKLVNFWGYNTVAFAAPKAAYAASADQHGQLTEFRDMVKAFHAAGIEVYLDVVFNHTGEGNDKGRTFHFRGLDNEIYYLLDQEGRYLNYSGVGNTLNCNHPIVRDLLMTCLRYWGGAMRVDGFRFDLASILGRDRHGNVLVEPPVIEAIAEDGVLADTKLIAEPWDAAGLYQVGRFPFGRRWSEWNGKFRDDVRRFWRGEGGFAGAIATRMCGSADLYQWSGRLPRHSVNFVTCHDGFTMWDLVSYNGKHNEANGEQNRDGCNENYSWNCGAEGPTEDPAVLTIRLQQAKNMMATLLLSQGVPMILAGDEFLRTQKGNNNAWCQDNDISWVDWSLADQNKGFLRFTREMIWLRRNHPVLRRRRFFRGPIRPADVIPNGIGPFPQGGPVRPGEAGRGEDQRVHMADATSRPSDLRREGGPGLSNLADIHWHGTEPHHPDFGPYSRHIAFSLDGRLSDRMPAHAPADCDFYIALNARPEALAFRIPRSPSGRRWKRVVDTAQPSPYDFLPDEDRPFIADGAQYSVARHSLIILVSEL